MANDKTHRYQTQVLWTGNLGQGTASGDVVDMLLLLLQTLLSRILDRSNNSSESLPKRLDYSPQFLHLKEYL